MRSRIQLYFLLNIQRLVVVAPPNEISLVFGKFPYIGCRWVASDDLALQLGIVNSKRKIIGNQNNYSCNLSRQLQTISAWSEARKACF